MSKARDLASAAPAPSTVSATEIGYLDGVTSAVQTQLDAKTAKSTLTTTGDIYYASAANTPARLGIGSTGNVLTVSGGLPTWAAASGWSPNYQLLNAGGTALTGATTVTVSGISGINSLFIIIDQVSAASVPSLMQLLLNADTATNYTQVTYQITAGSGGTTTVAADYSGLWGNSFYFATLATNAAGVAITNFQIDGTGTAGLKPVNFTTYADTYLSTKMQSGNGAYKGTSAISSVSVKSSNGNLDAGTIYVYGA